MPGGRCERFPSLEKKRKEWERERNEARRKSCPMRHPENGNCLPVGGFCLNAVSEPICKSMHMAYEMGFTDRVTSTEREEERPLTLAKLRKMDGEPVYLVPCGIMVGIEGPQWVVVNAKLKLCRGAWTEFNFDDFGVDWIAYSRPTEVPA